MKNCDLLKLFIINYSDITIIVLYVTSDNTFNNFVHLPSRGPKIFGTLGSLRSRNLGETH